MLERFRVRLLCEIFTRGCAISPRWGVGSLSRDMYGFTRGHVRIHCERVRFQRTNMWIRGIVIVGLFEDLERNTMFYLLCAALYKLSWPIRSEPDLPFRLSSYPLDGTWYIGWFQSLLFLLLIHLGNVRMHRGKMKLRFSAESNEGTHPQQEAQWRDSWTVRVAHPPRKEISQRWWLHQGFFWLQCSLRCRTAARYGKYGENSHQFQSYL